MTKPLMTIAVLLLVAGTDAPRKEVAEPKTRPPARPTRKGGAAVAPEAPRVTPYTGLAVKVSDRSPVANALQKRIADDLNAARPHPTTRTEQFMYLDQKYRTVGYHATIAEARETAGGGWHATIAVVPIVDSSIHGSVTLGDAALEEYEMSQGKLRFISGMRHPRAAPGTEVRD
jgi:hypothetical protein